MVRWILRGILPDSVKNNALLFYFVVEVPALTWNNFEIEPRVVRMEILRDISREQCAHVLFCGQENQYPQYTCHELDRTTAQVLALKN